MKDDSLVHVAAIPQALSNDFGERVYGYLQLLYVFTIRRVGSASLAEEIVAQTCHDAILYQRKLKGQDLKLWLFGIARRKIAYAYRDRKRRREISLSTPLVETHCAPSLTPEEVAIENESIQRLRSLILKLPASQREALLLQYLEQLSQEEAAEVMGKSVQAVNSLQQRARTNLQKWGCGYFDHTDQGGLR